MAVFLDILITITLTTKMAVFLDILITITLTTLLLSWEELLNCKLMVLKVL